MSGKKTILLLSDWYLPAYKAGGPVRSVAALVYHLKDIFDIYIITSDKDAFEEKPLAVKCNQWVEGAWGEKIFYMSGKITKGKLFSVIDSVAYDRLYINSFFSKPFSIYPLLLQKQGRIKKPLVLAPRGMLRPGALAIKAGKKNIFLAFSKLTGLHKNMVWHATSAQEEKEIKQLYKNATVHLAPNLTLPPLQARNNYAKQKGELRICAVTRLVRNKKIDFAIDILREIKDANIEFTIYGPAEDEEYYKECVDRCIGLPASIKVHFNGSLEPAAIEAALQQQHVFLLPTETENFGHAIVEAMLNGCIPVISDQTPWQDLEKNGVGWDIALTDKPAFIAAVKKCAGMDEVDFKTQSIKIQSFAIKKTTSFDTIKAYEQLFK